MSQILERMIRDMDGQGACLAGYLLAHTRRLLGEAADLPGEASLDAASLSVEALYERVLRYRDSLIGMDVPTQEQERHDRLVEAFNAYSEALLDMFDALAGEEALYHPRLLKALADADRCLYRHRTAAARGPGLSGLL